MGISERTNKLVPALWLGLILLVAMPALSFAQGRGQGRGRGSNLDKKCEKFVNCHDARDGRWDGRGPSRTRNGSIFRNRGIYRDRDVYYPNGRNRRVDRDGDGDFDRDDVILGRNRRVDRDGDGDFDRNDVRIGRRQDRERWERRERRFGRWAP